MAKTRSQTGNTAIKKEEQDVKPTLLSNGISNTRRSSRIAKRRLSIINNNSLSVQQVKLEEDTDTKALLKSASKYSKCGPKPIITQEQIKQLIHYIVNDNMSIREASRKVNISQCSGFNYYNKYKNDPEKKLPLRRDQMPRMYTQEQVGNLIGYINDGKMTLTEASAKADIPYDSGRRYYNRYLEDPNHYIPVPRFHQNYTHDQKNKFIDYVISYEYYHKYFKQQNPDTTTPSHIATHIRYTQEQKNELISYIVDDNMSINAASRKANFNKDSAGKYYRQYLIDNDIKLPVTRKTYTQDDINEFIGYIIDDKMSIKAASKKANMHEFTGRKYYWKYLKDHHLDGPIPKRSTQEQRSELIDYIVNGKMSITTASKKVNISYGSGYKYYHQYLNAQKRDGPIQHPRIVSASKSE